jgi:ssDNA-binding Zn-finger/Zn-ribbon topoisomerase 1
MAEKDRLGDKLHDKEKGEEDRYFARRDRELIQKMKQAPATPEEAAGQQPAQLRCPKCEEELTPAQYQQVTADGCPVCQGPGLNRQQQETMAGQENAGAGQENAGWLARFFRRSKGT